MRATSVESLCRSVGRRSAHGLPGPPAPMIQVPRSAAACSWSRGDEVVPDRTEMVAYTARGWRSGPSEPGRSGPSAPWPSPTRGWRSNASGSRSSAWRPAGSSWGGASGASASDSSNRERPSAHGHTVGEASTGAGAVELQLLVEDALALLRREVHAVVLHGQQHLVALAADHQADRRHLRREAVRVEHQVGEDVQDLVLVDADRQALGGDLGDHRATLADGLGELLGDAHQLGRVDALANRGSAQRRAGLLELFELSGELIGVLDAIAGKSLEPAEVPS